MWNVGEDIGVVKNDVEGAMKGLGVAMFNQ